MTQNRRLMCTLREYDTKQAEKPGYNIYAIAHYIRAANCIDKMVSKGVPLEDAIQANFLDRLQSFVLRKMGFKIASKEVIRNGRPDLRDIREECLEDL